MKQDKQQEAKSLCPFKRITEIDYSSHTGKRTLNERFAPCAGERCMAYVRWEGKCLRLENRKDGGKNG